MANSKLLPANSDYFICDVFNLIAETKDGEVLFMDRLSTASVESSMENVEIKAGQGNVLIATLSGSRSMTITTNTPVFMLDALCAQLGADVVVGAGQAVKTGMYDVVGGKITVTETPIAGTIKVFTSEGIVSATATNKEITVSTSDEKVKCVYRYATPATTETITVSAKKNPIARKVTLQTLVIDGAENPVGYLEMEFGQAKPDGAFSISTTSERQAQDNQITWSVLGDANGKLCDIKLIPIEEA